MQIKLGTVLTFMGNEKDLNVVIGFIGDFVICYEVMTAKVITYDSDFVHRYFPVPIRQRYTSNAN